MDQARRGRGLAIRSILVFLQSSARAIGQVASVRVMTRPGRGRIRAAPSILAAIAGAAVAVAQAAPAPAVAAPAAQAPRTITVQNLAPHARTEIAAAVVPFAPGVCKGAPDLHVDGRPTAWEPFGARWPDGSLRQAICVFPAQVGPLGELRVALATGKGPEPVGAFAEIGGSVFVVAKTSFGEARMELPVAATLEDNALRRVVLRQSRLGATGLVAEMIVTEGRGDAHAYVDFAAFFSDPTRADMQCAVEELAIEATGVAALFRHPGRLAVQQATNATGTRVVLLQKQTLGDGQGIRRVGSLLPALTGTDPTRDETTKAAVLGPLRAATSWVGTGAFGPFGEPATLPSWLQGDSVRVMLAARQLAFARSERPQPDPFVAYEFGMAKQAGQTGDQMDFGLTKLSVVAATGIPSFLLECEPSVLQEACRPVHMFEADGTVTLAKNHPQWIVWSGRTHWHAGVSPDRLGKPAPEPPFQAHGWTGKDRQHRSSNHLAAFAQLTGAHWARRELAHEAQLYLSGETTDPAKSTSGADAPRGAGRTQLAACWIYLATGDEELRARIDERTDRVHFAQWRGRELPSDAVRTMAVHQPDARNLGGKCRYWTPWQDAIAACGFAAVHRLTGNPNARTLAEEIAITVTRHGFLLDDKECIVATALQWLDGAPLSVAQQRDPAFALWSYGTGFNEWAIGAVEIARVAATARGDAELARRAEEIQRRVRGKRARPQDGWIDRLSEWDALRWAPQDN